MGSGLHYHPWVVMGLSGSQPKGAGEIPLLPISTGTNNVIPEFIEGTIAGLAAGYFSSTPDGKKEITL